MTRFHEFNVENLHKLRSNKCFVKMASVSSSNIFSTDGFGELNNILFPANELLKIEKFIKVFNSSLRTNSGICLYTELTRKVVEGQTFWKSVGNLIERSTKLKRIE